MKRRQQFSSNSQVEYFNEQTTQLILKLVNEFKSSSLEDKNSYQSQTKPNDKFRQKMRQIKEEIHRFIDYWQQQINQQDPTSLRHSMPAEQYEQELERYREFSALAIGMCEALQQWTEKAMDRYFQLFKEVYDLNVRKFELLEKIQKKKKQEKSSKSNWFNRLIGQSSDNEEDKFVQNPNNNQQYPYQYDPEQQKSQNTCQFTDNNKGQAIPQQDNTTQYRHQQNQNWKPQSQPQQRPQQFGGPYGDPNGGPYVGPQYGGHSYGGPQYGGPQYYGPQCGGPQQGVPQVSHSQQSQQVSNVYQSQEEIQKMSKQERELAKIEAEIQNKLQQFDQFLNIHTDSFFKSA